MDLMEQLSISLPHETAEAARTHAEQEGLSLSAFLAKLLEPARQSIARWELLRDLGADDLPKSDLLEAELELARIDLDKAQQRVDELTARLLAQQTQAAG